MEIVTIIDKLFFLTVKLNGLPFSHHQSKSDPCHGVVHCPFCVLFSKAGFGFYYLINGVFIYLKPR